jgi:hypothetical protein
MDGKGEKADKRWRKVDKKDAWKLTCVPSHEERKQGSGDEGWERDLGNEIRMYRKVGRFLCYLTHSSFSTETTNERKKQMK